MQIDTKRLLTAGIFAGLLIGGTSTGALASHDGGGSYSSSGSASSYINGDAGANADVDPNSSCFRPDQYDMQRFSDPGPNPGNRNVHNDACFLDRNGNKLNGQASFESSGVGFISACPDPDGAGTQTARLTDKNGDGRNDLCFQTAFQTTGKAGDFEFHARMNNTGTAGTQYVTWCSDRDADGCSDEWNKSSIRIDWSADGTATYSRDDRYGGWGGWGS